MHFARGSVSQTGLPGKRYPTSPRFSRSRRQLTRAELTPADLTAALKPLVEQLATVQQQQTAMQQQQTSMQQQLTTIQTSTSRSEARLGHLFEANVRSSVANTFGRDYAEVALVESLHDVACLLPLRGAETLAAAKQASCALVAAGVPRTRPAAAAAGDDDLPGEFIELDAQGRREFKAGGAIAAAADKAAAENAVIRKKLEAELEVARKQADKASAEIKAARQEAADRVAAALISEKAAVERAAAQHAAAPTSVSVRRPFPTSLYITNIPSGCTQDRLKIRFSTYGRVTACKVLPHKISTKSGRYAFVVFESADAAQKAMAAKVTVDGVQLVVRTKASIFVKHTSGSKGGKSKATAERGFVPRPFPSLDAPRNQVSEHAEILAQQYMIWLGFKDATPVGHLSQPDGGIDISSTQAVAQVKAQWHGFKVPRPVVQAFSGACSVNEHMLKGNRLFFAPLYTDEAVAYADELNIKLFTFNPAGLVSPENMAAKTLLASIGKPV